jgi:hypothetical protein
MLSQRLRLPAAIDAHYASPPRRPASTPANASSNKTARDGSTLRRRAASRKSAGSGLPGSPEFLGIDPVDTNVDKVIKSCRAQNGGAVFAGRADGNPDAHMPQVF